MILAKTLEKLFGYLASHYYGSRVFAKLEYNLLQDQSKRFSELGLSRDLAIDKLNSVLSNIYGRSYTETNGMWSEHLILFAAISESDRDVRNILEIGTFNGETSRILSALFPDSKILTIDLKFDEILKTKMYEYETSNSKLIRNRSLNLSSLPNVNFLEMNSLELINFNESFDLIWIDGDHSYPIAAIDIANSIRLLSPAGAAICDDVCLKANEKDKNGRSKASIYSLEAHVDAKLVEFSLIHKRIGVFFNYPLSNKKYLGFVSRKVYN